MGNKAFISTIAAAAVADMRQSKVLASITIAQAALESAWGASAPGNNLFGIKGSGTTHATQEYINGQWVVIQAGFRCYTDWCGSIADHSQFLIVNERYTRAGFFDRCGEKDYKGAARALQSAGYATDPQYANKLIQIIEANGLAKFDVAEEDEYMLPVWIKDTIINTWISPAWHKANEVGDQETKDNMHLLANELRKASGCPEE